MRPLRRASLNLPHSTALPRRSFLGALLSCLSAISLSGCGPQLGPYRAKVATPPTVTNCFDTVGHRGFKPFVLGGTCYCNPVPAQIAAWQKEGYFVDQTPEAILAMYSERGVKTVHDHRNCNNTCEWGPHVVKGGKCLVPPTPMTDNFEEVATGEWKKA